MTEPEPALSRLFTEDHRALDDLLEEFRSTAFSDVDRRRELFGRFSADLRRHIAVEETHLFPPFEHESPAHRGLTERLRDEHRRILEVLDRTERDLRGAPRSTSDLEEELVNVLWSHNAREEEAVYPWFDRHLPSESFRTAARELKPEPRG